MVKKYEPNERTAETTTATTYGEVSSKLLGPLLWHRSEKRQLLYHRITVLLLTFLVYATYHASRKPLSIVNGELHAHCDANATLSSNETQHCGWAPFNESNGKQLLGFLDTVYLSTYALGLFCMGYVAERSNLRVFLPLMMVVIGILPIMFGLARPLGIHSLWYFIILQVLGGFAQASGWPSVVAVVGTWFGNTKKGLVLGLWNWHTSIGNILGIVIAGAFVESDWGLSFIVPGIMCIAVGGLVLLFLIPKPYQVGLEVSTGEKIELKETSLTPNAKEVEVAICNGNGNAKVSHHEEEEGSAITVWQALFIPGVVEFAICLFFSKLVSYTFQFWLPLYLNETGHVSVSSGAFKSIVFEMGGCLGSILAGFLADRIDASGITCIVFLVLSIPSLYTFNLFSNTSMAVNQVLQFIAGTMVNGPYALITTAVSANLGGKVPSKSAMATVSGIIDGTGSIGAAVGPMIAAILTEKTKQWNSLFYMCIASNVIAILSLLRIGYQEYRRFRPKK